MPCQYYSPEEERAIVNAELDKLTRLLCEATKLIDFKKVREEMSQELWAWIFDHAQEDEKRHKKERTETKRKLKRKKALTKLSKADRKALGLDEV